MIFAKSNILICGVVLFCFATIARADYIEGIDTTDANGYSLDSTFWVSSTSTGIGPASKTAKLITFYNDGGCGYFNYSFKDLKLAPDTAKLIAQLHVNPVQILYCFIVKKIKDSTYTKIQIQEKLSDGRYVFKYGTNTTPNNRLLEKSDYDRAVRYKPNCVHLCLMTPSKDTLSWEPPLPNNNHLLGYIYYVAKNGAVIDTAVPIDMSQWDSVAFFDTTKRFCAQINGSNQYFNLVALYSEGKSDFIEGWTKDVHLITNAKQTSIPACCETINFKIVKTTGGILIRLLGLNRKATISSLAIYNINGGQIIRFSDIASDRVAWTPPEGFFNTGVYIAKAQLSDKSTISRAFMITR